MLTKLFAALLTVLLTAGVIPSQPTPEAPAFIAAPEVNKATAPTQEVSVEVPSEAKPEEPVLLTGQDAQTIALAHAGLKAQQVTRLKAEKDREKGVWIYEVEFRYGNWEYDYEIHAQTGKILEWDKEFDD